MSERPSLSNYEELKVVRLDRGASEPTENLAGKSEDPKHWDLIDFSASGSGGFLLIGKRTPSGKATMGSLRT